jgi:hypothetical protein
MPRRGKVRRWARRTPNAQMGMTLVGLGCVCLLVAAILIGLANHWI